MKKMILVWVGLSLVSGVLWACDSHKLAKELSALSQKNPGSTTAKLAENLAAANRNYADTADYQAIFVKTELDKEGKMGLPEKIYLKFEKPFKIFMGWLSSHKKGLQVVYERGKHDNKLAIHKPGLLLGLAPVVFLDQNSPWVREGSAAYNIEDAGIGAFLQGFSEDVLAGDKNGQIKVTEIPGGFSVSFPGSKEGGEYFAYRVDAVFDHASKLPVEMKLYDWNNQLTGEYAYQELQRNVGLTDDFQKQIDRHLFKVYAGSAR